MTKETTSEAFFEAKYRQDSDPWNFATDGYEQSRYAATLDSLKGRRFQRAFEPGCSIGVLTEQLANFCEQVVAIDISETAAAQAKERCRYLRNVEVRHASLPGGIPSGRFDLILLSEIGYYFEPPQLGDIARSLISRLVHGGLFVAVNWLGSSPDHPLTGEQVYEILSGLPQLQLTLSQHHPGFRLDQWTKS